MLIRVFLISFFLSLPFWLGINLFQENLEKFFYAQIGQPFEEMVIIQIPERIQKPTLELDAKSAISLQINANGKEKIIFQKNPEEILPIASLTKLMTAVIVLEDKENYNSSKTFVISEKVTAQDSAPYDYLLRFGQPLGLEEALKEMLMYSSNDVALALSKEIGINNFIERMNQKAEELELKNTHFVNPNGLDPENKNIKYNEKNLTFFNYSTVKDFLKLAQYILENHPLIFAISLKEGPYPVRNGLFHLSLPENLNLIGGKTGYTNEAGGCFLVVFQDEKGFLFFNLILGTKREKRVEEMQKLIDWLNL